MAPAWGDFDPLQCYSFCGEVAMEARSFPAPWIVEDHVSNSSHLTISGDHRSRRRDGLWSGPVDTISPQRGGG